MKALVNGTLYPVSSGAIPRGTVLIEGGKIAQVGSSIPVPPGAEVIDVSGMCVLPGLIDAHTHMGLEEEGVGEAYSDLNEETDPITPHLRAMDGITPADRGIRDALESGITTAFVTPGSANVIGGLGVVVKTVGRTVDDMAVRDEATGEPLTGLKIALGENPKRTYGPKKTPATRMGIAGLLRETLIRGQNYMEKRKREEAGEEDLKMEVVARALFGAIPVRIHVHRADDILTALRIAEEFKLRAVLDHATEAHKLAEELAARGIPVVVGPTFSAREKVELKEVSFRTPGVLARAGVTVAIMSDHSASPNRYLNVYAGLSVREGMAEEDALRAITLNAASILGIADRVGSLEVGKEADLAVFSDHPFELRARNVMTFVRGELVYDGRQPPPARP